MQRYYLELRGVKSFWIELMLKHEHIPFGSFTDSLIMTLPAIGDLITGDLNLNMQHDLSAHKFDSLCEQLSIVQSIEEPTLWEKNVFFSYRCVSC